MMCILLLIISPQMLPTKLLIKIVIEPDSGKSVDVTPQLSVCGASETQGKSDVTRKINSGDTRTLRAVFSSSFDFSFLTVFSFYARK